MQRDKSSRLRTLLGKKLLLLRFLDIVEKEENAAQKKLEILKREYLSSKSLDRKKELGIEAKKIKNIFLATILKIDTRIN